MGTAFEYRRSAIARPTTVAHDDAGLTHGEGPRRVWTDLERIEFAETATHETVEVSLTLAFGGAEERLKLYSPRSGAAVLYDDLVGLFQSVQAARPDVSVLLGYSGRVRRTMFVIGLACFLFGLAILGLSGFLLVDGALFEEVAAIGFGGVAFTGLGAHLARANASSLPQPTSTLDEVIGQLQSSR